MQNRTLLEELPDAEAIDRKYIRKSYTNLPVESGMSSSRALMMGGGEMDASPIEPIESQNYFQSPSPSQPRFSPPPPPSNLMDPMSAHLRCSTVAEHVKNCPICTHYYNNTGNMLIYINIIGLIVIVFLVIKLKEK